MVNCPDGNKKNAGLTAFNIVVYRYQDLQVEILRKPVQVFLPELLKKADIVLVHQPYVV